MAAFPSRFIWLPLAFFFLLSNAAVADCCKPKKAYTTHAYHQLIVNHYRDLWAGDLSLLNTTISPTVTVHADRFPDPSGSGSYLLDINTDDDFLQFVIRARYGWDQYRFGVYKWIGEDYSVALRWYLDGIIGANFTIPTTLQPGDHVTYNGTEYLDINPCTGLIQEIASAQDLLNFFYSLGLNGIYF